MSQADMLGKHIAGILSGGNVDTNLVFNILSG
jgi:hypothetical protein